MSVRLTPRAPCARSLADEAQVYETCYEGSIPSGRTSTSLRLDGFEHELAMLVVQVRLLAERPVPFDPAELGSGFRLLKMRFDSAERLSCFGRLCRKGRSRCGLISHAL